ncbi:hypothetical protein TIFTF001_015522 [Ficus carica]|uniref:Uncharacterized protein n=1 Tax=Ficus carica TaxID=3494 RepID=A0AA88D6L4_FICCA|nr:hypothetical protein TIFTF001_015522 [Ficus carica]
MGLAHEQAQPASAAAQLGRDSHVLVGCGLSQRRPALPAGRRPWSTIGHGCRAEPSAASVRSPAPPPCWFFF